MKRTVILFLVLVFASAACAEEPSLEARVRAIVEPQLRTLIHQEGTAASATQAPGGIVAVWIHGHAFFYPAGRIDPKGTPPTPDTVFGLGSVTKTFTTSILGQSPELFAQAVTAGALPPGYALQPAEGAATFDELATFTAGIPTTPSSCSGGAPPVCTQAQFVQFINGVTPPNGKLPAPNVYSDSSIGFLAQILMFREGYRAFGADETNEWFRRHLFSDLGMKYTGARPADATHPLSDAYGYDRHDGYQVISYMPWVPWGAAGRDFSTASDMLRFVQAITVGSVDGRPLPKPIVDGMRRALEPRAPLSGKSAARQAFAWVTWPEERLPARSRISGKAGGVNGVSSYVAVNPDLGYGVVILTNMHHVPTEPAALAMMKDLQTIAAGAR